MFNFSHLLICYVVFLLLGALLFYQLNQVEEKRRRIDLNRLIDEFVQRHESCLTEVDLHPYYDFYLNKTHAGLWSMSVSNENLSKWTFGQGLFFATSLLTTVGYGTPNLITAHGKVICIVYTSIGLVFAILFQRIFHGRIIPIIYRFIKNLSRHRLVMTYSSKDDSYFIGFLVVTFLLGFSFLVIPTLLIYFFYVPNWSSIELIYFAVTTNYMIGLGDLMPCTDQTGHGRSSCALIMTIYVIVEVLVSGILGQLCLSYRVQKRDYLMEDRHPFDLKSSDKKLKKRLFDGQRLNLET